MKKDFKYIIKRIIIGVGIAVVLGFLNKFNVYADELTYFCMSSGNIVSTCSYSENQYHVELPTIDSMFLRNKNSSYGSSINAFYNSDKDFYHILSSGDSNDFQNFSDYKYKPYVKNDITYYLLNISNVFNQGYTNGRDIFITTNLDTYNYLLENLSPFYDVNTLNTKIIEINNVNYYFIYTGNAGYNSVLIKDSNIISTDYNTLYFQEYTKISKAPDISYCPSVNCANFVLSDLDNVMPSYYKQIDFANNQGVIFVPKDYSTIDYTVINSQKFIDFNMYYSGVLRQSYFNIYNNEQIKFEDNDIVSFDLTQYYTNFPMHFNNSSDDLSAIMFTKTLDSNEVILYYDSRYFNYYFIEDLEKQVFIDISFIDESGNNSVATIGFNEYFEDYWKKGFDEGGDSFSSNSCIDGGLCFSNILSYFDFLKIPFNWLKSLNRNSCSPLNIPIPFVNSNMTINCLSSTFKEVLGNLYNILFYIITGLYAYRITIMNIDTITDTLDPNDDKLEVVAL